MSKEFLTPRIVTLFHSCFPAWRRRTVRNAHYKTTSKRNAEKKGESYLDAITYISTRISFALLRSAIKCIRQYRGSKRQAHIDCFCSAIVREGRLDSLQVSFYRNSIFLTQLESFCSGLSLKFIYEAVMSNSGGSLLIHWISLRGLKANPLCFLLKN